MKKRKKKIVPMLILALLICLDTVVFAQDDEDTRRTLRGLKEIFLYVEPLDPQIEKMGLTRNLIQMDTETKLKLAGIVQRGEEFAKSSGHPYLYVNVNISMLKTQITRYLFYIRIELNQEVALVRTPDVRVVPVPPRGPFEKDAFHKLILVLTKGILGILLNQQSERDLLFSRG